MKQYNNYNYDRDTVVDSLPSLCICFSEVELLHGANTTLDPPECSLPLVLLLLCIKTETKRFGNCTVLTQNVYA